MNRILPDMSPITGITAMCEGNPGGLQAMMELMGGKGASEEQQVEGYMDICRLDDAEIYGSYIWVCYKDIYNFDVPKFREAIRNGQIKKDLATWKKKNE